MQGHALRGSSSLCRVPGAQGEPQVFAEQPPHQSTQHPAGPQRREGTRPHSPSPCVWGHSHGLNLQGQAEHTAGTQGGLGTRRPWGVGCRTGLWCGAHRPEPRARQPGVGTSRVCSGDSQVWGRSFEEGGRGRAGEEECSRRGVSIRQALSLGLGHRHAASAGRSRTAHGTNRPHVPQAARRVGWPGAPIALLPPDPGQAWARSWWTLTSGSVPTLTIPESEAAPYPGDTTGLQKAQDNPTAAVSRSLPQRSAQGPLTPKSPPPLSGGSRSWGRPCVTGHLEQRCLLGPLTSDF